MLGVTGWSRPPTIPVDKPAPPRSDGILSPAGFSLSMYDPYFISVAVIAVLVVGLSKAGLLGSLGVIGVPLLTLIMPARDAAGMMLPVLLAMDAIAVYAYRKEFSWHNLKILLPGAAPQGFTALGGFLAAQYAVDAQIINTCGASRHADVIAFGRQRIQFDDSGCGAEFKPHAGGLGFGHGELRVHILRACPGGQAMRQQADSVFSKLKSLKNDSDN